MKKYILILLITPLLLGCSDTNIVDKAVFKKWKKCKDDSECIIDFTEITNFQWDTVCFYSGALSLDEINLDLGFDLKTSADSRDRLVFLKEGKFVYQVEWYFHASEKVEEVAFSREERKFKISKQHAKFRIEKREHLYFLVEI